MKFGTNNTEVARFDTSGNLGIGTSSPQSLLSLYANSSTAAGQYNSPSTLTLWNGNTSANIGGTIAFGGAAPSTTSTAFFASIWSGVTNSSSTGTNGYLAFGTKTNQTDTSITERWRIDSTGNLNAKTSNAGIIFNNSSALTNSTLNDYETGTWTPNQGAGLTVVGSFSSTGRYIKIGTMVFLQGSVSGSTSVALSNAGQISTNMPFTSRSTDIGFGSASNGGGTVGGTTDCGPSVTILSGTPAIAATNTIYFSISYQATF